jgi:hypothetical protein
MSKPVTFDKTAFDQALKAFRRHSKKAVQTVLIEQARGIMTKIIDATPPGGKNVRGQDAKKRGESKVAGDIRKIMEAGRAKDASSESPTEIHRRYRNSRGQVRREIHPKIKVKAGDLARLIREKKRMVGFLASGWSAASSLFGARLPAWITRHSGKGEGKVRSNPTMVEVTATNSVGYAHRVMNMNKRIQVALNAQAGAMRRQVEHFAAKQAARKAGFKA